MKLQRTELKPSNPFYISKHRNLELKHFCLQYDEWQEELRSISFIPKHPDIVFNNSSFSDHTSEIAEKRAQLLSNIHLIEHVAKLTDSELWNYILQGVTHETTYESLHMLHGMPCCKSTYYNLRHKFFYILSQQKQGI